MKKRTFFFIIILISVNCFSQIVFEKGYYVNNQGEKIIGEIKNRDWKNNPKEIEFREFGSKESTILKIALVKEFGIDEYSKYVRASVKIDRSSNELEELSTERNPIYKQEELFLKVLVLGKSNLYQFREGNLERYFYTYETSEDIEPLIYKMYIYGNNLIGENKGFKQQLQRNFVCVDINEKDLKYLLYQKRDLTEVFVKYNECSSSQTINFVEKQKKDLFNLNLRFGVNSSSLEIGNSLSNTISVNMDSEISFRMGVEAEMILPFNKNRWSIIIEPTYQYFQAEKDHKPLNTTVNVDYKSIEIPFGIRRYFFLENDYKIFVNGMFMYALTGNSTITFEDVSTLEILSAPNLGFGLGLNKSNKIGLEIRYNMKRDLLNDYGYYFVGYSTLSFIMGYTLF